MSNDPWLPILRAFEAAWAKQDGAAIAALFSAEAVFTTPLFERSIGRAAIERGEQHALNTYFRGTRVELLLEHATPLREDVAIVHTANRVMREGQLMVESHAMMVLVRRAGAGWEIAAFHNLVPLQGPPPAH